MLRCARILLLTLLCTGGVALAQVNIQRASDRIVVDVNGAEFTQIVFDELNNKPYLYPLRAASGTVVTRHFPMETIPGESHDHPHHRGVSFTYADVNGINFWSSDPSQKNDKQGRIRLDRVESIETGAKSGTVSLVFRWESPTGQRMLTERRRMVFYAHPSLRIVDFDFELTAADGPVRFGDTKEGMFSIRLATGLTEEAGGVIVSASGLRTEKNVWGTRANWIDDSGEVDGEKLGVAILDHPENPRYPTYWHCRGYGLIAANIFGWHDFQRDSHADGSLTLNAGETLRLRYRVVVHPGNAESARIGDLYRQYAREQAREGKQ
jgi:hypothetical protein